MMEEISKLPLPEAFLNFLEANGIDPSIYMASDSPPRYLRLKPGSEAEVEEIEAEIKCKLEKVNWLPGFYSLPPDIQIANSKPYQDGKIYGIDAASGAAVSVLKISPGGSCAKLCIMLDLLGDLGSVTAVNVARHRLAACRTTKPWKERKRVAKAREAKSSQLVAVSENPELIFYGRLSGVVGLSQNELYKTMSDLEVLSCGYDKVLVDAECTHDGSVRHIQKFEHWGWRTLQHRVLYAVRTDSLTLLQLKLLRNGFRLLKVGGLLVYSTCSLTVAQNEDIVDQFLKENASAGSAIGALKSPMRKKILPLDRAELQEIDEAKGWTSKSGRIPMTMRFDHLTSQTGGLFVAKFTKLAT
ncbi:hypothetical protein CRYUN_Cryun22dG0120200 [Craigia yunnanensis]